MLSRPRTPIPICTRWRGTTQRYDVTRSLEALIADVSLEHQALWPAIQRVIHTHATWGAPSVMEGWSLWPERVIPLRLPSVHALWLVAQENPPRQDGQGRGVLWWGVRRRGHEATVFGAQLLVQYASARGGHHVRAHLLPYPRAHQYRPSWRCALSRSDDEGRVASQTAPNHVLHLTAYSVRCALASAAGERQRWADLTRRP